MDRSVLNECGYMINDISYFHRSQYKLLLRLYTIMKNKLEFENGNFEGFVYISKCTARSLAWRNQESSSCYSALNKNCT